MHNFVFIKVLTFPYKLKTKTILYLLPIILDQDITYQKGKTQMGSKDAWVSGHSCSDTNIYKLFN